MVFLSEGFENRGVEKSGQPFDWIRQAHHRCAQDKRVAFSYGVLTDSGQLLVTGIT